MGKLLQKKNEFYSLVMLVYNDPTDICLLFGFSITNSKGRRWNNLHPYHRKGYSVGKNIKDQCLNSTP